MPKNADVVTLEPLALLKKDRALAEKAWNRMHLDDQVRAVLRAPLRDRLTLCELSHHMPELVQALPPQEIWLTIQEMGGADALALFHQTSAEQVQFCLDVEAWSKDRWLPEPTFEWLRLIAAGGVVKILQFFHDCDIQLIGLLMKQWVCVYWRVADEDPGDAINWPRDEAPVTLDGTYYFQVTDARIDQWLRPMIESYGKADHEGLIHLFRQLLGVTPHEQEELAYACRERRLSEWGFPAFDEAIGVYRRLAPEDLHKLPRRKRAPLHEAPLHYALQPLEEADILLREALRRLDDRECAETCATELARLANRVLIADGHAISVAMMRTALAKVIGAVNIGLERASAGDVACAVEMLRTHWLVHLFQLGFSTVMELAEHARGWLAAHPTERLAEDDDPTTPEAIALERVRAASWKWPKYYVGPQSADGILHREFQCLRDVAEVSRTWTSC